MRLVELVHEEERVGCKKISVGVYILENIHKEGNVHHSFIKKKSAYEIRMIKEWWERKKKKRKNIEEKRKEKGMMRC